MFGLICEKDFFVSEDFYTGHLGITLGITLSIKTDYSTTYVLSNFMLQQKFGWQLCTWSIS